MKTIKEIKSVETDRDLHLVKVTFDTDVISEEKIVEKVKENLAQIGFFIDKVETGEIAK
ncbi:MAG: hypothetical protein KQH63_13865 [Desulfobulbaceae bacterium]|nr:hypothetical protein [Desulfobulbaceae bacterium]